MLNTSLKQFKQSRSKAALAFIVSALLITILCCGKRKPPLPPVERAFQRTEISALQTGNTIILSWLLPSKNATDKSAANINRVDVYRLAESLNSPLSLSEEDFSSNSILIASLPVSANDFEKRKMSYSDSLQFGGVSARLRYAIRFVNLFGQKAAFSNFLLIEPTAKVAVAPTRLHGEVSKDSIKLNWKAPETNIDGSKPANILGYNIYRFGNEGGDAEPKIQNSAPLGAGEFADKSFEFGKTYKYFVRAVSVGTNGEPLESLDSEKIEISAKDIFPPNAPGGITIAAAPNNLSIFFAFNQERDVAGYRVYRSTDSSPPKSEWTLLTKELLKTNTFQDSKVESGKTYFYYLTAVDNAGNESAPSEVVSETAP